MPLINGQKMACEPCIRGHRSTKCTHASERLMVPVRKPGRPLSSCPHPPSRPCSCGGVTAAIPRKQKCKCGSSETTTPDVKPETEESSMPSVAASEIKASKPAHRVQKSTSKGGTGRKPSIDPAKLERMDTSQFNVMPGYNGIPQSPMGMVNGHVSPIPGMHPYGAMGIGSGDSNNHSMFGPQPMMFPMYPQQQQPMASPMANSTTAPPKTDATPAAKGSPQMGSCCGGGRKRRESQSTSVTSPVETTSTPDANEPKAKSSCCSSKNDDPEPKATNNGMAPPPQTNGMMMPAFAPHMAMPNGMYPFYPHPTVFTYPAHYGSFMHPLQPEQWRQMMAALTFAQPTMAQGNGYNVQAGALYSNAQVTHTNGNSPAAGTSHECTCGEGCQCVGCAAHPYNEATQDYIRSAWNSMMDDSQSQKSPSTNGNGSVNGRGHSREGSTSHTPNDTTGTVTNPVDENNTQPPTPSDGTSAPGDDQILSANDFFFVTYPFGETCAGETASCPCGDDCQCIGCVIHSNPTEPLAD